MTTYCNGFYSENDLKDILEQIVKEWENYGDNKAHLSKNELQDICDDLNLLGGKLCMIGADLFADKEAAYMSRKREQEEMTERLSRSMTEAKAKRKTVIDTLTQQQREIESARISKLAYNIYAIAIPNLCNSIARRIKMIHEQSPERSEWRQHQAKEENEAVMTSDVKTESLAYSTGRKALRDFQPQQALPPAFQRALRQQQHEDTVAEIKASPTVVNYKKVKIK